MNKGKLMGVLAATCLALTACGGSSSHASSTASLSAFKSGFSTDQTQFRKYGTQLGEEIAGAGSKTDAQLASELGTLASRAQQKASQLAKLTPPAKYKPQVDSLVSAFGSISTDLTKISSAATKHDAKDAESATRTLVRDAAKVKNADTSLSKALGLKTPAT